MRKVLPRVAVGRIVLADRAPRAFAPVRPPAFPVVPARPYFLEASLFVCHPAVARGMTDFSDREPRRGFSETGRVAHFVVIPGRNGQQFSLYRGQGQIDDR